jgi:hypothetical protein
MSLIIVDQSKVQAKANSERVAELKKLLADTDYKVLPGYDRPSEEIVVQRQQWRDEIRALENS